MAKPKLFMDANVLIAAAASPTGGSAAAMELADRGLVSLFSSKLVLIESERNIVGKLSAEALLQFYRQLGNSNLRVVNLVSERLLAEARKIVAEKDAHVLAAAVQSKVDVLLTLDRKHLLVASVRESSPVLIQTPGEFLQKFVE